jgi:hypothetical protein
MTQPFTPVSDEPAVEESEQEKQDRELLEWYTEGLVPRAKRAGA